MEDKRWVRTADYQNAVYSSCSFIYPGPKTSSESNKHINKPDQARIEELQQVWFVSRAFTTCEGPLAQSAERRADNAKVVSSRLTWTIFFLIL